MAASWAPTARLVLKVAGIDLLQLLQDLKIPRWSPLRCLRNWGNPLTNWMVHKKMLESNKYHVLWVYRFFDMFIAYFETKKIDGRSRSGLRTWPIHQGITVVWTSVCECKAYERMLNSKTPLSWLMAASGSNHLKYNPSSHPNNPPKKPPPK